MRAPVRRSRTRLLAAATIAVAALSLTACNDEDGTRDEGAAKSTQSSTGGTSEQPDKTDGESGANGSDASDGGEGSGAASGSGGKDASGGASGGATGGGETDPYDPANRVPCSAANTSITATPVQRPLNYMLLTVTNTGSKMCDLKGYPRVKFEDAQSVPPVMENTKPQAVTSLKPGGKGYAGVILSAGDGSGGEGRTAQSLEIGFEGSDRMAEAALQAKGVHVDDKLRVTYWLTSSTDALN
ncbi:DUF4232 domain-containing protein [Streptomyces spectabilis]|uniref:DUF4232 domain-containing protein n=1 Tax=Streptomyces spectabilis TaxID=68270 RepID=A0A516RBF6_STRST|nr:DUF4232 domain-containing protein [Streptomyces spectabilis]QDQ12984.1 DUF4232 domain-containing protein [Streptomyces spectabilis]